MSRKEILAGLKAREKLPIDEAVSHAAIFVLENLPDISVLEEIAKGKKGKELAVGNRKWVLRVINDEGIISSGKTGKIKHIILTNGTGEGKMQVGIFTEKDFGLVLGVSFNEDIFVRFEKPLIYSK